MLNDGNSIVPLRNVSVLPNITLVGGILFKTAVPANATEGIDFIRYIQSFQPPVFSATEADRP